MKGTGNLYKLMERRYGYKAEDVRYRPVWAPTLDLSAATDTDLAYIAGIIDGEGTIMYVTSRKNPIWTVRVSMTDRPVIEWIHHSAARSTPGRRAAWGTWISTCGR